MAFAKYVVFPEAGSCACSEVQAASHLSLLALPTLVGSIFTGVTVKSSVWDSQMHAVLP